MTIDAAIDFETLDTKPTAICLSFAIVFFEREKEYPIEMASYNELSINSRYFKFDIEEQYYMGRTYSEGTLDFWQKQPEHLRKSQMMPSEYDTSLVDFVRDLYHMKNEFGMNRNSVVYCRGQSFDFSILRNIVEMVMSYIPSSEIPIKPEFFLVPFFNERDIRSHIASKKNDPLYTKDKGMVEEIKAKFDIGDVHDPITDCILDIFQIKNC